MKKKTLTEQQALVLLAFMDAFDKCTTGVWSILEEHMREAGFEDPEGALEDARVALQS